MKIKSKLTAGRFAQAPIKAVAAAAAAIFVLTATLPMAAYSVTEEIPAGMEEEVSEAESSVLYYEVPLSKELQDDIRAICDGYDIDMALILAMIKYESGFNQVAVGDGEQSFGLMQVQPKWHKSRMDRLGVTDLMEPRQNVTVGADLLSELLSKGRGEAWALMAYNGGESLANSKEGAGMVSSYASKVMQYRDEIGLTAFKE